MFVVTMALGNLPPQLANNVIGKHTSGLLSFLIFFFRALEIQGQLQ